MIEINDFGIGKPQSEVLRRPAGQNELDPGRRIGKTCSNGVGNRIGSGLQIVCFIERINDNQFCLPLSIDRVFERL